MTITTTEYCSICQTRTKHRYGKCVDCVTDDFEAVTGLRVIDDEELRWRRTKRKIAVIATCLLGIWFINWAFAKQYSLDDIMRTACVGIVMALGAWFASTIRHVPASDKNRDDSD